VEQLSQKAKLNKERGLYLITYDGINLFWKSKWTLIAFETIEEGKAWLDFLSFLDDESIERWISTYSTYTKHKS
jgi:hypothetical protein